MFEESVLGFTFPLPHNTKVCWNSISVFQTVEKPERLEAWPWLVIHCSMSRAESLQRAETGWQATGTVKGWNLCRLTKLFLSLEECRGGREIGLRHRVGVSAYGEPWWLQPFSGSDSEAGFCVVCSDLKENKGNHFRVYLFPPKKSIIFALIHN